MLEGKVIWISGASSGIGEALAKAAAAAGMRVVISARNEAELERVKQEAHGAVAILPLDVSKPAKLVAASQKAADIYGSIDVLVSNAGIGQRALAIDSKLELVERIFAVNFFGSVALTQAVLPSMLSRGSGMVVAISSVLGSLPLPRRSAYVASKHAIEGYYQTLRIELKESGVKVLIVRPGLIATNFSKNVLEADCSKRNDSDSGKWRRTSADACAKRILVAIQRGKSNLTVGGIETWSILARQILPSAIFESLLCKMKL